MAKIKKIKIYTHHKHFFSVGRENFKIAPGFGDNLNFVTFFIFYYIGLAVVKVFKVLKIFMIGVCYHTGAVLVNSVIRSAEAAVRDIRKTKQAFPRRLNLVLNGHFGKALFSFCVVMVLAILALGGLKFTAKALDIKNKMLNTAFVGNIYLNNAKNSLVSQDFNDAQNQFAKAYKIFSNGQAEINESNQTINQLLSLLPQKREADRLLNAAEHVSQAGEDLLLLTKEFSSLKISQSGINSENGQTKQTFTNVVDLLKKIDQKLTKATDNVNQVNPVNFSETQRVEILDLKLKLNSAKVALKNFSQIFTLTGELVLGDKTLLVLFENNNELRASGGFPGTYGDIKLKDGHIQSMVISSIYDLDGQLNEIIQPPRPLLNMGPRWYMRDSGWFSDFPQSAKEFSSFFEKTRGETPDMVLVLTPDLIVDWLKILGPIELPSYGVTLDSENFVEKTQAITTISNNLPTNSPKQILADLVPLLLQKLSSMSSESWPLIVESLQNNLNGKQLVLYSNQATLQQKITTMGWSGSVTESDRDYLSVVSSNLGGTKTDLFVKQTVSLKTSITAEGKIIDELTIERTNTLPDLSSTNNLSFIRILVPLGSKLTSNIGFDYRPLDYPEDLEYKIDSKAYEWERNSVTDNLTGTVMGQEANKTFFGNWQNLKGGETRTIKLIYELPFKLDGIDRYSLLLQKQIGSQPLNLTWAAIFPSRHIEWSNFDPNLDTEALNKNIILDKDYFLGLVLKKQ